MAEIIAYIAVTEEVITVPDADEPWEEDEVEEGE